MRPVQLAAALAVSLVMWAAAVFTLLVLTGHADDLLGRFA